jgi:hypothetical protein
MNHTTDPGPSDGRLFFHRGWAVDIQAWFQYTKRLTRTVIETQDRDSQVPEEVGYKPPSTQKLSLSTSKRQSF